MDTNCHEKLVQDSPRKVWLRRKQEAQDGGDYPQGRLHGVMEEPELSSEKKTTVRVSDFSLIK